jgi:hypothetical protein
MKRFYLIYLILFICCKNAVFAQISQGGVPLFLDYSLLRSSSGVECIEMPPFDIDSVKQIDELNKGNMRGSFQFAHKFYTHIEKGKQGNTQVLADGTKVWQVSIRSKDAYSINLLFTKFHLPEGGKLFIYNANRSHVIGAFDHNNNSPEHILPVRSVAGDLITLEYSEPANAAFEGELVIGEVNHDYRDILSGLYSAEPGVDGNSNEFACMQDVLCSAADERIIRSTVLLMINGNAMCTGSLVNNTNNDETPYLLTAVHCLNGNFEVPNPNYVNVAGTVIAFFNYDRPVCDTTMKATEEMSLAGAYYRAIIERKDVALLELKEKPPVYYNAYYAGLNVDSLVVTPSPYINIHHPSGSVKKYGISNQSELELYDFEPYSGEDLIDNYSHFGIVWSRGSTAGGSSGSPLFDSDYRIMGTLSGGSSFCTNQGVGRDYFATLFQSWGNPDLKTHLDPASKNTLRYDGYDPHAQNPLFRISNADYNNGDKLTCTQQGTGLLFGKNSFNFDEAAEEFNLNRTSEILGVYVLIPPMPIGHTSGVKIKVYDGAHTKLGEKSFIPQYKEYTGSSFIDKDKTTQGVSTETFVAFDQPVAVGKKFFVAYTINNSNDNQFCVYNTLFASPGKTNTAWVMIGGQWAMSSSPPFNSAPTSLALQPLIRYTTGDSIDEIKISAENLHYNRLTGLLSLDSETKSGGQIFVYAINGQLVEQIPFSKGKKSFQLSVRPKGNIGIVKMIQENDIISKKILY